MEGPNKKTPEEIAEIEKSRAISDAELLKGGAEYVVDENDEGRLALDDKQIENIELMEGPNKKTPEEIAEIERRRVFSDARLLNGNFRSYDPDNVSIWRNGVTDNEVPRSHYVHDKDHNTTVLKVPGEVIGLAKEEMQKDVYLKERALKKKFFLDTVERLGIKTHITEINWRGRGGGDTLIQKGDSFVISLRDGREVKGFLFETGTGSYEKHHSFEPIWGVKLSLDGGRNNTKIVEYNDILDVRKLENNT